VWFESAPLGIPTAALFDLGVADVDADGTLDLFTSNHNDPTGVFLGDGDGGLGPNVAPELGLSFDPAFPGLEETRRPPAIEAPGFYLYWDAARVFLVGHQLDEIGPVSGRITLSSGVRMKAEGFDASLDEQPLADDLKRTEIRFEAQPDTPEPRLMFRPRFQAVPLRVELAEDLSLERVHIGARRVSPRSHRFTLALRDRHGMAWADFDGDDRLDLFIARGGLKGRMAGFPETYSDELFCSREDVLEDCTDERGLVKGATRARAVAWVDFDRDARLDLYVQGVSTPDQLFQQQQDGRFIDVAPALGLATQWTGPFVWIDPDDDGDLDLLTPRHSALVLHRNKDGRFEPTRLAATTAGVGTLSVADYDADGDVDVLRSAPQGNLLLVNRDGVLEAADHVALGLPSGSLVGRFVDYDNDGLTDIHLVPGGLYRQAADHTFELSPWLGDTVSDTLAAAFASWFDADADGDRDLVLATREQKTREWRATWHRNVGARHHWLQVDLIGPPGNRQALGASVRLTVGDRTQLQPVGAAEGSRFSQGHYRLYFGLGDAERADSLEVRWPDGSAASLRDLRADRVHLVRHPGEPSESAAPSSSRRRAQ